jgi:membrane fusion protein (multidrug efflux system)
MKQFIKTIFLSLSLISCGDWEAGNWNAPKELPVLTVSKGNFTNYKSYPTRIEGIQDIEIRAKINGYIQNIFVDEGQFVKKGQPLFLLETNVISQNVEALTANIKSAEASVNTAQIEVERLKPLVKKEIVSPIQLQTAEARLQESIARLSQAKGNMRANRANQQYAKILSPIDGYVGKFNYRQGSLVGPGTPLNLTTISNTDQVFAYFSVSENELEQITKSISGKNINEKLQALPKVSFKMNNGLTYTKKGKLEAATGKLDVRSGTIQLRAIFDNKSGELLSGNTGLIQIPQSFTNQVAIPEVATLNMQNMKMVYVLSAGDTIRLRPIEVTTKADRYLLIKSGLQEGEKILAQGLGKVYPNSKIIPKDIDAKTLVSAYQAQF